MKFLIVEDDPVSSKVMVQHLAAYGNCETAADGDEAIESFRKAWNENSPYDLITMDIMMPHMDGQKALQNIRELEHKMGLDDNKRVKVIMTTALGNPKNVIEAFYKGGAMAYIVKPIKKETLLSEMKKLGFAV
ncbi:response regulator [candidate division KSB1 bacterium]|nr:response regulator [candidate division KSB1 bacterium]